MSPAAMAVSPMVPGRFAYDGLIDPTVRPQGGPMRKKLLQHTLSAAIAAWAMSMAHGPITSDRPVTQASLSTQTWALR